jgi:hypothetical protein
LGVVQTMDALLGTGLRSHMKLWISTALTPHGNDYGLVAVVAETRQEAIDKANAKLSLDDPGNYIPNQRYAEALHDNLDAMREVTDEVFIDWDAAQRR